MSITTERLTFLFVNRYYVGLIDLCASTFSISGAGHCCMRWHFSFLQCLPSWQEGRSKRVGEKMTSSFHFTGCSYNHPCFSPQPLKLNFLLVTKLTSCGPGCLYFFFVRSVKVYKWITPCRGSCFDWLNIFRTPWRCHHGNDAFRILSILTSEVAMA